MLSSMQIKSKFDTGHVNYLNLRAHGYLTSKNFYQTVADVFTLAWKNFEVVVLIVQLGT